MDVARRAGVSTAAVSKVLRGAYGVSQAMREAVTLAIDELGYRPKVGARSMRGSTYTIGFVVPGAFSPFFSEIYDGVADELSGTRYRAIVALAPVSDPDDSQTIHDLLDRQVDGVILLAPTVSRSWIEDVAATTPAVVVARHDRSTVYDSVYGDDNLGAELVMRHLLELGHRDIVHIANRASDRTGPQTPHGDHMRRLTYERLMREAGLEQYLKVVESRFDEHAAHLSTRQLFDSGHLPTAVFAGADEAAFGVLRALADLPAPAAAQIAVVGYDNTRFADHPSMSLTSVDQAGHELGRQATALLLSRLAEPRPTVQQSLVPRLVVRRTSVPGPVAEASHPGERP